MFLAISEWHKGLGFLRDKNEQLQGWNKLMIENFQSTNPQLFMENQFHARYPVE